MNDNPPECKGCDVVGMCGRITKYAKEYPCPCFNCLLKMMCSRSCDEFNMFEDYVYERLEKEEASELKHIKIKEE